MKIYKFLMAFLIILPFLQSCQGDISELADPRDAIVKNWRVSEPKRFYDAAIAKDANESTKVIITNFHDLSAVTTDKVKATLAGLTLTIPQQTLNSEYTISGSGTISSDWKNIKFTYTVKEGLDPAVSYTADYGPVVTVKKKTVQVSNPIQ